MNYTETSYGCVAIAKVFAEDGVTVTAYTVTKPGGTDSCDYGVSVIDNVAENGGVVSSIRQQLMPANGDTYHQVYTTDAAP